MAQATAEVQESRVVPKEGRGPDSGQEAWSLRRDPHCFGCNFTSTYSIDLFFNANTSATMISETLVAFIKPEGATGTPGFFSQAEPLALWL